MTEREKMLAGKLYDCGDPELLAQWHRAKNLVRDFNLTQSEDLKEKERILTDLLGGRGQNLWITPPSVSYTHLIPPAVHHPKRRLHLCSGRRRDIGERAAR